MSLQCFRRGLGVSFLSFSDYPSFPSQFLFSRFRPSLLLPLLLFCTVFSDSILILLSPDLQRRSVCSPLSRKGLPGAFSLSLSLSLSLLNNCLSFSLSPSFLSLFPLSFLSLSSVVPAGLSSPPTIIAMHMPSLSQLVYNTTFPRPRTSDPASFAAHITRNLVPEVRIETSTFYGSLDCIEAQYPGLDYSYGPHRMRLGRFPWHRRLFRVFDELRLTEAEISSLCRWEGTKSARERYEKEEGVKVQDTTANGVRPASPSPLPSIEVHFEDGPEPMRDSAPRIESQGDTAATNTAAPATAVSAAGAINDRGVDCVVSHHASEDDSSDEEMESCGVELNHRLMAATAAREQGVDVPLDEDWEQWLKEAGERGSYTNMIHAIRADQPLRLLTYIPPPPFSHPSRTGVAPISASFSESYILSDPTDLTAVRRPNHPSRAAR